MLSGREGVSNAERPGLHAMNLTKEAHDEYARTGELPKKEKH